MLNKWDSVHLQSVDIQAKDKLYWYLDPTANINESRLSDADVSKLNRVSQILQQFDYLPQLAGLQNLILKLRNQVGLLGERPEDVIAFEQMVAQGVSFLTPNYTMRLYNSDPSVLPIILLILKQPAR